MLSGAGSSSRRHNILLQFVQYRVRCRVAGRHSISHIQPNQPNIMRAFLFFIPVVLAACSNESSRIYSISQRQILKQSQAEIALREPWAADAAIFVTNPGEISRLSWKVRAGAFDRSDLPKYKGIHFVSGTERELQFTADGCLTSYADRGNHCLTTETEEAVLFSGK